MNLALIVIKAIVGYLLIFYYGVKYLLAIGLLFLLKDKSEFWIPKSRPNPPKCLRDKEHGEHKFATCNGIKLHYVEKGDHQKPLMIFVHGFPEFWYSWRHQLHEFSKDYWCVALDMRGYNESDKPKDLKSYKLELLTSDIRELLRALGREKCTLVGHDWGAVVCWNYVVNHMETIDKYIMMGAPSPMVIFKLIGESWAQFRMSWYVFFFQCPWVPEAVFRLFDFKSLAPMKYMSSTVTNEELEVYKYVFSRENAITPPINYYRANFSFGTPQKYKMPDHFAPGLFLLGERDLYISKKTGYLSKKYFKNLDFKIVEKANHFCQQDKPDEVNRLMREFLNSDNDNRKLK